MDTPTFSEFKDRAGKLGHIVSESFNIVGWRSQFSEADHFNDTLSLYWNGDEHHWSITTLPGIPYLKNPINPKGSAILVPGQYLEAYGLGVYHGYQVLKQIAPVRVYRDRNKDVIFDKDPSSIEQGLFGIHIHRAGLWNKIVGISSAGCQVFQKREDFEQFISICQWVYRHEDRKKFTYTLMERYLV